MKERRRGRKGTEMCKCGFCRSVFPCFVFMCVCAGMQQACLCVSVEFPLPFAKRVERPASEENSIFSCSYSLVNHLTGMSGAFCCSVNKRLSFAFFFFFVEHSFPSAFSRRFSGCLPSLPTVPFDTHAPSPPLPKCCNLLMFSYWCNYFFFFFLKELYQRSPLNLTGGNLFVLFLALCVTAFVKSLYVV